MRFNKETFEVIHKAEVHIAMDMLVMVRDPEITVSLVETVDPVVPHAIVFGENDLYGIPAYGEFI